MNVKVTFPNLTLRFVSMVNTKPTCIIARLVEKARGSPQSLNSVLIWPRLDGHSFMTIIGLRKDDDRMMTIIVG